MSELHKKLNLPIIDINWSGFTFSQGSLQAYEDCPRLFELRYIHQLSWPAPDVEPDLENERYLDLGSAFHKLIQQYLLGIPIDRIMRIADHDTDLARWWLNFSEYHPPFEGYTKQQEITLATNFDNSRLVAKYDLILVNEKIIIYDWKTSRKQMKQSWMKSKLQSRVYPLVLVEGGSQLNNRIPLNPEQIEMIYWFSNYPKSPIRITYSQLEYQQDHEFLRNLIVEIKSINSSEFPKTENLKRCQFCRYRSLCDRGVKAGSFLELEEDLDEEEGSTIDIDFEQIAEIEF
jgi:CRISPR/Cas system-associated exonuclease Cas4 (RecB family)